MPIQIRDRAGLAEMLDTQRARAMACDCAEPRGASVPLVVYLCAGAKTFLRIPPPALAKAGESSGAAGYVLVGCLGILAGKAFLENVLPLGRPGGAWSAGTILFLNLTVGVAVAAGFVELLSSFVEKALKR